MFWAPGAALRPAVAGLGELPGEVLAAAGGGAAGVAFQAGAVAHHGEVAAFRAAFAFIAFHAGLGDLLGGCLDLLGRETLNQLNAEYTHQKFKRAVYKMKKDYFKLKIICP
ncbi:hypothetical protein J7481_05075 [Labrenzia sp. R4_2]|uniref:hypothetical protein n=1 Tax=Labrenzia sp. R4_2 TaxID=2821107 RepID=UPI001AD9C3BA|nr:hypothetical protein [Labrenzia sp. R4_2]MBO9418860.1 hypothetical protein [Labrenzia sp. R4_2]